MELNGSGEELTGLNQLVIDQSAYIFQRFLDSLLVFPLLDLPILTLDLLDGLKLPKSNFLLAD